MQENLKMIETSLEDLKKTMELEAEFGCFEDMKIGDVLYLPVSRDADGRKLTYGPIDFSGKSNSLPETDWEEVVEEKTGFKPIGKTILKRSENPKEMFIFARASSSVGPCDMLAVYPSILHALAYNLPDELTEDEEFCIKAKEIFESENYEKAKELADELFIHSFFTGLIYGPFEHVSGPKPTKDGYVEE